MLCQDIGFTESHQAIIDVGEGRGQAVSRILEEAQIITNPMPLPWDKGEELCSGIRIGVQEITRQGMKESEMEEVAEFMSEVISNKSPAQEVTRKVANFVSNYQQVLYRFGLEGNPTHA